jgi:hypothetical protein
VKKSETKLSKFLRRKISTKKLETSGIAAITFGDLIYDMARVDQRYILGADFSRPSKNLSSVFKIGKQNLQDISDRGDSYLDTLHNANYSGYTHEFVTHMWHRNRGDEVEIPEKFNQKGWDAIINGQKTQIKFGSVSEVREARVKYPEYPVDTDLETAKSYKDKYPDDASMVMGTTPKSLTENIVSEGREASIEVYENQELFGTGLPEILGTASLVSIIKNTSNLTEDKTDLKSGLQNIFIDSAGRGAAMWAGGTIGSVLGPIGTAVGVVAGAFIGKDMIDDFKIKHFCAVERTNLRKALNEYVSKSKKIFDNNRETLKKKKDKLQATLGDANFRSKVLKETKISEELYEFLKKKMEEELKLKNKMGNKFYWQYVRVERVHDLDSHDSRLHKWAFEAEELNKKAKISDQFLFNETKNLIEATEKFIKVMQKVGI